jgi:hypothetical protein
MATSKETLNKAKAKMPTVRQNRYVIKLLKDRKSVEGAFHAATARGYTLADINFVLKDEIRDKYFKDIPEGVIGDKSMEGLALGGALGGSIVGIATAVAAIGTGLMIPGLNLIVSGPLAIGLAGAGAGGITGGLIGALIGLGIPEMRVEEYEKAIKSGYILMTVQTKSEEDTQELENELKVYDSDD